MLGYGRRIAQARFGRSSRAQRLAGIEDPIRVEARLDRPHQRHQVALLLLERVDLAHPDPVLTGARAALGQRVVDDGVHQLVSQGSLDAGDLTAVREAIAALAVCRTERAVVDLPLRAGFLATRFLDAHAVSAVFARLAELGIAGGLGG